MTATLETITSPADTDPTVRDIDSFRFNDTGGNTLTPFFDDRFQHIQFTELDNPDLAFVAQVVQAKSYRAEGFVNDAAIDEDGRLAPDIDKARGPNVIYYLASEQSPDDLTGTPEKASSLRVQELEPGMTFRDFPGYVLSEDRLHPETEIVFDAFTQRGHEIKEIGALSRTPESERLATFEVIRAAMQDSFGKGEVWFFTMVGTTYDSLVRRWGDDNLVPIGEDIKFDDPRVKEDVSLKPLILIPDDFLGNLRNEYEQAKTTKAKIRYAESLVYFSDGLEAESLDDEFLSTRADAIDLLSRTRYKDLAGTK